MQFGMRLKSVVIERFKRLERVEFDVDGVNILIGGNNSGKSTIIQAVHFGFTLFQSLEIAKKWPDKTKKSSTISPAELIYIPSEDPYSLGFGGRLLEDEKKSIVFSFTFDNGEKISLAVRKGRITNILVEPDNVELAKQCSNLEAPYTIYSPGLAGVSRAETFLADGNLLRTLARGDANVVLRNILYRLKQKPEWRAFEEDLCQIFPNISLDIVYNKVVDQYISITVHEGQSSIPLDLAGTGLLQAVQILAYIHLFSPKLIILDEPDSHLHPNNQRLLCSLLATISIERGIQVLITTHSRHVLDAMYGDAKLLWVQDGSVVPVAAEDQVDLLLELGALDIREKVSSGKYKVLVLTEDRVTRYLNIVLRNSGFSDEDTTVLPYNGVTSTHLLKPLVKQIKELSQAAIIVHRDRDYMDTDEIEAWKKEILAIGAEPFVTSEIDIEGYFCTDGYIKATLKQTIDVDIEEIKTRMKVGEDENILSAFVNGRIDLARKSGTIGKLDIGKLSAAAAKEIGKDPLVYMKGKRKLARLRHVLQEEFNLRFEVDHTAALPSDEELERLAVKHLAKWK
jgi:ABC-type branched-subunit amino acid transport system ATPase component